MRLQPERAGSDGRINASLFPPCGFITTAMGLAMMAAAQRHGKFIADLSTKSALLHEAQMMGIYRSAPADQTRLFGHEPHVIPVTNAPRVGIAQIGLINGYWPGGLD